MRQNILDVYDCILEYEVKGCVKLGLLQSWALLVEKSHGETPTGFTEYTYHENLILLLHWTNELANSYSVNSCFNSRLTQNDAGVKSSLFPSNLLFCSREEKGLWGETYGRSKSPHYSPSRVTTNRLLHDPTVTAWTVCKMNKGVTSVKSLHRQSDKGRWCFRAPDGEARGEGFQVWPTHFRSLDLSEIQFLHLEHTAWLKRRIKSPTAQPQILPLPLPWPVRGLVSYDSPSL